MFKYLLFISIIFLSFKNDKNQDNIIFETVGRGKNIDQARENAFENAFYQVLYRGIPNSYANKPLVNEKNIVNNSQKDFLKSFFDLKYYKSFIISYRELDDVKKIKKGKELIISIDINYLALKKDLEINGIIRKFGY